MKLDKALAAVLLGTMVSGASAPLTLPEASAPSTVQDRNAPSPVEAAAELLETELVLQYSAEEGSISTSADGDELLIVETVDVQGACGAPATIPSLDIGTPLAPERQMLFGN